MLHRDSGESRRSIQLCLLKSAPTYSVEAVVAAVEYLERALGRRAARQFSSREPGNLRGEPLGWIVVTCVPLSSV